MRLIEDETTDPSTTYRIEENGNEIFQTIYPAELLVRVAQVLPNSEVRLTALEVPVGESSHCQEVLIIKFLSEEESLEPDPDHE